MRLKCPHCNAIAAVRTADPVSKLTRVAYYDCKNPDCNHGFKVGIEIIGTTRLSLMPNPAVVLPLLKGVGKNYQPIAASRPFAQVDALRAANAQREKVQRDKEPA
ncbi:ogr/Delta-like zinc finger family protein [Aeromonas rivipollensis]|uniref:ogr/Delta-like zinc finger family protein n=1 Tax=Aeromonas rivipollensis TaxID=948519 RepID=UPI0038D1B00E